MTEAIINPLFSKIFVGLVPLSIDISRLHNIDDDEHLAWHIADNRSAWAICGRTSGVISFHSSNTQTISVDLMPLFLGKLRLPQISLKRFASTNNSEHDSSLSSLDSPMYKGNFISHVIGCGKYIKKNFENKIFLINFFKTKKTFLTSHFINLR
jgi:hypothetical protein